MQAIMEPIFDILYLITVSTIGIYMIVKGKSNKQYLLFGIMAVVLGFGDAFHLIPRVMALTTENGFEVYAAALGIGKFITSITMTGFYVILYFIWRIRYKVEGKHYITAIYMFAGAFRIVCCLFMEQNDWIHNCAGCNMTWTLLRNIPFIIVGVMIITLFAVSAFKHKDKNYYCMFITIILSFGFYIPVLFWADKYPMIGLLMIPKTCAYVWTVVIGLVDMIKVMRTPMPIDSVEVE